MGKKINVTGLRIGTTIDWRSKWFAENKDFGKFVIEDVKIRKFFEAALKNAGLERVVIERNLNDLNIILRVARPGVVIGRGGAGINMLKEELFNIIDDLKNVVKPNVTVCSNSSMGFFVHVEDIVKESIENDEYIIKVKILLDVSNDYVFASKEYEVDLDE